MGLIVLSSLIGASAQSDRSVVVHNLDVVCISVPPVEADPPLIVDANAVPARPIPLQKLQSMRWWHAQIIEFDGRLDSIQAHLRAALNLCREPT
jgi:hypothetical protein